MLNKVKNIYGWMFAHKVKSGIIILAIIFLAYFSYTKIFTSNTTTKYVLGTVEKGMLVTSVSGTGQVSATSEIGIKPKVSGDVTSVKVKAGDTVKSGQVLVVLDSSDSQKSLRDAKANLVSASITLQKTLLSLNQTKDKTTIDLAHAYDSAFSDVSSAFVDMPSVITGMNSIIYSPTNSPYFSDMNVRNVSGSTGIEYKYQAGVEFDRAKDSYQENLRNYRSASRSSSKAEIVKLVDDVYANAKALSIAVKDVYNTVDYIKGLSPSVTAEMTTDLNVLSGHVSKMNSLVSSLQSTKQSITDAENAYTNTTVSLDTSNQFGTGESLDVQSARLAYTQKQNALNDVLETIADYTIRAPLDGIVAKVDVSEGGSASSGTSVVTVISPQKVVTVSLNEVDAAKVKQGQKATLTFDALPDLTMTGTVSDIDGVGTASQGVVSYNAKISLDTQDEKVKAGMSVSASIVTNVKENTLLVSSSAIKNSGDTSYVQEIPGATATAENTQTGIVYSGTPNQIIVTVGDSNDTETEITSGLKEGDVIVLRSVTSNTAKTTQSSGLFGVGGGGSGATRAVTGR